jgi:pimeloyl-ACP methyl ester carboxylesterase
VPLQRNRDSPSFLSHLGCQLAFSQAGEGARTLFIQGTGLHGDGWWPQLEELSRDHACLWFDNRGMGRSQPRGDAPISVEQMAQDALALLDHVGWDDVHIVGHSLGGCIALELALQQTSRVRSLSLLCTAADGPGLVAMDAAMVWRGLRMQLGTRRSRRSAFLEIVLTRKEHDAADIDEVARDLEPIFGQDLATRPPITFKQVRAMAKWQRSADLGELAGVPTVVVGADGDVIARPRLVEALARGIPGARLVQLEGAAHGVTVTQAGKINELLREHIGAADAGATPREAE